MACIKVVLRPLAPERKKAREKIRKIRLSAHYARESILKARKIRVQELDFLPRAQTARKLDGFGHHVGAARGCCCVENYYYARGIAIKL